MNACIFQGLRMNRTLLTLSLATNYIGDRGAIKLAEVIMLSSLFYIWPWTSHLFWKRVHAFEEYFTVLVLKFHIPSVVRVSTNIYLDKALFLSIEKIVDSLLLFFFLIYSWLLLSRPRLSRITAYLEDKIWSLPKQENLTTGKKILWKRGEIAPKEQFLLFSTIF